MDEEIRMLQLDMPKKGKSIMEMQQHFIDEAAFRNKPIERAFYILSRGDELQKLSVLGSLPELLVDNKIGVTSRIIPKIQQEILMGSSEFNVAASKTFDVLMHMDVPVNLVPQILRGIENKDPVIANAWMETLISVIPILKESIVKHEILSCAITKSQLSKTSYFRVSSCKILGKLSIHRAMDPFEVKKDILPLVQSLCQDCSPEVRAAMCKELPNVAQGLHILGKNIIKSNLLPLLVELCSDENIFVRSAAIESVVTIIPYLGEEIIETTIIPLIKNVCLLSDTEGDIACTAVSNNFNQLILNLHSYLLSNDALWFMDYFNRLRKKGFGLSIAFDLDPSVAMLCRENCAQTLPTIAFMTITYIPQEIPSKWYTAFRDLTSDPCFLVRKAVALSFVDCVQILGANCNLLVSELTKLLRDEDIEVLQSIVPKVGEILKIFELFGILTRDLPLQATLDIGRALLKCINEVFETNNWRMKESILKQLEILPFVMSSDYIHQNFTSVVFDATLNGKAKPVRSQATRTLLVILRYNLKENQRKWIRESINERICKSKCCYTRQMYVELCRHAIDIYSTKYFKEHFYVPLLSLADDPISVVRISMTKLCPKLKQMLIPPIDGLLYTRLEHVIGKIEAIESDKDVISALTTNLKSMPFSAATKLVDYFPEEKQKIEEEVKISQGKFPLASNYIKAATNSFSTTKSFGKIDVKSGNNPQRRPRLINSVKGRTGLSEKMPFLDHHFYIDAGVSLPNSLRHQDIDVDVNFPNTSYSTSNLALDFAKDLQISNNNKENHISTENLDNLLTKTSNITDDVKVNIMKKITRRKLPNAAGDSIKSNRRRCSCILENTQSKYKQNDHNLLKRRSLNMNIINNDRSKIPISSKTFNESNKRKSCSDQSLNNKSLLITSTQPENTNKMQIKKEDATVKTIEEKQKDTTHSNETKDANKTRHISNLPLLIKRKPPGK